MAVIEAQANRMRAPLHVSASNGMSASSAAGWSIRMSAA